jgi:anti-anti-sigma regulatory factor
VRFDGAQLSVEVVGPGLRVVRMAGVLDRRTVARLARVVAAQLERPHCAGHIVVDLGEVRYFEVNDLDGLLPAQDAGRRAGVRVHLAGLAAREALLPKWVIAALAQFSVFATVEQAQRDLVARAPLRGSLAGPRSRYG